MLPLNVIYDVPTVDEKKRHNSSVRDDVCFLSRLLYFFTAVYYGTAVRTVLRITIMPVYYLQ